MFPQRKFVNISFYVSSSEFEEEKLTNLDKKYE